MVARRINRKEILTRLGRNGWELNGDGYLYKRIGPTLQQIRVKERMVICLCRFPWQRGWRQLYRAPLCGVGKDGRITSTNWY